MFLLVPGRHHLLTKFQFDYLSNLVKQPLRNFRDSRGKLIDTDDRAEAVLFAVTSANHSNTRRNPLPLHLRSIALEAFGLDLQIPCYIFGIDDVGSVSNFSSYTIKRIKHESEGVFEMTPSNTLVVCSTPVLEMYERDGYKVLPAELEDRNGWHYKTSLPWDLVEKISADANWEKSADITSLMHESSVNVWSRYRLGQRVQLLFRDKMISADGDLTTTRDYNSYVRQMDEIAALKFRETASSIRPGRIGDIGCAVGSWIKLASDDPRLRESDFYGIEVARHLHDICQQRKHNGEFSNPFVFFSQRNAVTGLVFERESMNTIHTSSLTHEIESYGSRQDLISFIKNRFEELAPGGVWINRDVVGPVGKDQEVYMKLCVTDGRNEDVDKVIADRQELAQYLEGLSTAARFKRFAQDFRKNEGYFLSYRTTEKNGEAFVVLKLGDACEFMSKKDYVDNWQSEMHETFCFWSFDEWKSALTNAGFKITDRSGPYVNRWIVENRLKGKVELFESLNPALKLPYPVTNMLIEAEKQ